MARKDPARFPEFGRRWFVRRRGGASFGESVGLGHVGGEPQDHGVATDLAIVVEFARLFFRRWNHHLEEFEATRTLDLRGFHGLSIIESPPATRANNHGRIISTRRIVEAHGRRGIARGGSGGTIHPWQRAGRAEDQQDQCLRAAFPPPERARGAMPGVAVPGNEPHPGAGNPLPTVRGSGPRGEARTPAATRLEASGKAAAIAGRKAAAPRVQTASFENQSRAPAAGRRVSPGSEVQRRMADHPDGAERRRSSPDRDESPGQSQPMKAP